MIQQTFRVDPFKERLRESLQRETLNSRSVRIARHANVYTCGDQDEMVYFIESGQIKLLMLSPEGKECLLAIHSAGDIFGELILIRVRLTSGNSHRDGRNDFKENTLQPVSGAFGARLAA